MSPYRVSARLTATRNDRKRRVVALTIGAFFANAVTAVIFFDWCRERRAAEATRVADEENARRLNELQGSHFGPPTPEERASLETRLDEARRRAHLPKCRCAPGDPLCEEIPRETCQP